MGKVELRRNRRIESFFRCDVLVGFWGLVSFNLESFFDGVFVGCCCSFFRCCDKILFGRFVNNRYLFFTVSEVGI